MPAIAPATLLGVAVPVVSPDWLVEGGRARRLAGELARQVALVSSLLAHRGMIMVISTVGFFVHSRLPTS